MAHVEHALGDCLGRIEAADDLGAAGVFDLEFAARHPVDLGGEEVVAFPQTDLRLMIAI